MGKPSREEIKAKAKQIVQDLKAYYPGLSKAALSRQATEDLNRWLEAQGAFDIPVENRNTITALSHKKMVDEKGQRVLKESELPRFVRSFLSSVQDIKDGVEDSEEAKNKIRAMITNVFRQVDERRLGLDDLSFEGSLDDWKRRGGDLEILSALGLKGRLSYVLGLKGPIIIEVASLREVDWTKYTEIIEEALAPVLEQFEIRDRTTIAPYPRKENDIDTGRGELPYFDLYQWTCQLTTEQKQGEYFPGEEARQLVRRLAQTKGNLIAVIGLQGIGKTALRQHLWTELYNLGKQTCSLKWMGPGEVEKAVFREKDISFDHGLYDEAYVMKVMDAFNQMLGYDRFIVPPAMEYTDRAEKALRLRSDEYYDFVRYNEAIRARSSLSEEERKKRLRAMEKYLPLIERKLGRKGVQGVRKEYVDDVIYTSTLLMDFPDYDKQSRSQMAKDLKGFQAWWEDVLEKHEGYEQACNIVVFWQKELWGGHFSFGKFDVVELKPWQPLDLASKIDEKWSHPFAQEALLELAVLSRGIWRRFKKYMRICLDHLYSATQTEITVEDVKQWISLDQLVKDMELELMDLYPRQKENRRMVVMVLRFLREKGATDQPAITRALFEDNKMACSRLLNKLEAYDYVASEYRGRSKVWRIV